MELLQVVPIHEHKNPKHLEACCNLINSEWPRSFTARFQSLYLSNDKFPASLVMFLNNSEIVGHLKITEVRKGGHEVFIETVVIHKNHRGKGWGRILMEEAEDYIKSKGKTIIYLSTQGQEGFYSKLGYNICEPINYFGYSDLTPEKSVVISNGVTTPSCPNAPPPPPLPATPKKVRTITASKKTYMKKTIKLE